MPERTPSIVIVGGGFGGLAAAKALKSTSASVVLIDRANHHLFQPLLYQVAGRPLRLSTMRCKRLWTVSSVGRFTAPMGRS
jgi:NADH dehydrogenase FAD-containing subunit